jgi:hypothetical protein
MITPIPYAARLTVLAALVAFFIASFSDAQTKTTEGPAADSSAYVYKHLFTQHQSTIKPPSEASVIKWLLDEINNESLMRSLIQGNITGIESNGRNQEGIVNYYTPNHRYVGRLTFRSSDVTLRCTPLKTPGDYQYEADFKAYDNFHRGQNELLFTYSFEIKVQYLSITKAYEVDAVSYPKFIKTKTVSSETGDDDLKKSSH